MKGSNKYLGLAFLFTVTFVVLTIIGNFIFKIPACNPGSVLHYGVCTACEDENCDECSSHGTCTSCEVGYYV